MAWTSERHIPRGKRTRWPVDVGAGAAEDLGRLGEVDDLDADLLEERVGVGFDLLETLCRDDLDRRQLPGQVRQRVHGPGQALGLARGPTASHGRVFEVRDGHLVSSGAGASAEIVPAHGTCRSRSSEAKGELAALEERQAGTRGATASPTRWNAIPRAVSSSASAGLGDGRLGDDEGVGVDPRSARR